MYAIIDIETTGGNPEKDKITEIAVLIHNGQKVIRSFSTLINPECHIPYNISSLTGITDEMVANAPKFYEIARELIELTADKTFVAHNVSFDYGFVRNEFKRLGYNYYSLQLCTVRLARKLIPGHQSYSLGRICNDLQIPISSRHRALGDAEATARLFELLIRTDEINSTNYITGNSRLLGEYNTLLDINKIKSLPEEPGVYYLYNKEQQLIYIGKSKNIKKRVLSHLNNHSTSKGMKMCADIADVSFETTGSELVAMLKESFEIKKYKPLYNRRQRRSIFRYGLKTFTDQKGYIRLSLIKTDDDPDTPLACFTTKAEALSYIAYIIDRYKLCQKLCGRYPTNDHCFHYEIGACSGACIGKESPEIYNRRVLAFINNGGLRLENVLIIDEGRNTDEKSVIKINNGKYIGYGFFSSLFLQENPELMHECITEQPDNREVQQIIKRYLVNNKVEKLMEY